MAEDKEPFNVFNKTPYGITFTSMRAIQWFVKDIIIECVRKSLQSEIDNLKCCGNCEHCFVNFDELACEIYSYYIYKEKKACKDWTKN